MKKTITVRFIIERDYEITCNPEIYPPEEKHPDISAMQVGDIMVMSLSGLDYLQEDSLLDKPVSGWRPYKGRHIADANVYNLTMGGDSDGEIEPWTFLETN